ncbi:putative ribonuclease H-like domain-containing protein [Tanacetum coccineum]
MYCLVVTDAYSRFTWVLFLASKDETSGILKSFINGIENLVDHKVKVIRCDNGTEFKKRMNQFCERMGSGPDWLFDIDALTRTMNYEPIVAGTQSNGFVANPPYSQDPKSYHDDGSKPSSDDEKKVNAVGGKTSIELPFDLNMSALEDYNIFDFSRDDEDDGAVANMNNLDTTIQVSPNPTTRIHKDRPLNQVIGDLQSATQTRKMSNNLEEHGFEEPKKVIHALKDPSWIEAMQEELLQFKLQEVWTLVDLPNGKGL